MKIKRFYIDNFLLVSGFSVDLTECDELLIDFISRNFFVVGVDESFCASGKSQYIGHCVFHDARGPHYKFLFEVL